MQTSLSRLTNLLQQLTAQNFPTERNVIMIEQYALNILELIRFIQAHPNQCDIIVGEI